MTARKKWSADVTEHSDAMDLEDHVFESHDAKKIAASLKRSAEHSDRRKAEPFQSAMSMLNFYINRAGKTLSKSRHAELEKAKSLLSEIIAKQKSKTEKPAKKAAAKKAPGKAAKKAAKKTAKKTPAKSANKKSTSK